MTTYIPVTDDEAADLLGEGVHTGLRKGTEAAGSSGLWRAIAQNDSGWEDAIRYAIDGLAFMGYRLCREWTQPTLTDEERADFERYMKARQAERQKE